MKKERIYIIMSVLDTRHDIQSCRVDCKYKSPGHFCPQTGIVQDQMTKGRVKIKDMTGTFIYILKIYKLGFRRRRHLRQALSFCMK